MLLTWALGWMAWGTFVLFFIVVAGSLLYFIWKVHLLIIREVGAHKMPSTLGWPVSVLTNFFKWRAFLFFELFGLERFEVNKHCEVVCLFFKKEVYFIISFVQAQIKLHGHTLLDTCDKLPTLNEFSHCQLWLKTFGNGHSHACGNFLNLFNAVLINHCLIHVAHCVWHSYCTLFLGVLENKPYYVIDIPNYLVCLVMKVQLLVTFVEDYHFSFRNWLYYILWVHIFFSFVLILVF